MESEVCTCIPWSLCDTSLIERQGKQLEPYLTMDLVR